MHLINPSDDNNRKSQYSQENQEQGNNYGNTGQQQGYQNSGYRQNYQNEGNQNNGGYGNYQGYGNNGKPIDNKKMAAGLLGIFLGPWGVHKFYLGYSTEGIIQILITLFSCGTLGILGIIEGIVYLTKSDEEFYYTYQVNKKGWF
ncbi:TM2 domain-containing membrane protein YozV [Myroides phaeus]|uniref:TM2 domain-containing membrane protein YozV n=2 Tax=Myroides phaeus TaxID=702745 RepID=A0A1G8CKM9_9FLAO|nr:TM2 domain-containing membrane protein YozV [Myroides phaeus]